MNRILTTAALVGLLLPSVAFGQWGGRNPSTRPLGTARAMDIAILDGSGSQITSFGGGTQQTDGDPFVDATSVGTGAMGVYQATPDTVADDTFSPILLDANGRVQIAVAGDVDIIGHALFNEDFTASSTAGATQVPVDMSFDSVYEVPINTGTWADTMRGLLCDLVVSSSIQGVDLTASGEDCIQLIDKGTTNAAGTVVSVLCKLHPRTLTPAGVV